jgi:hypothetical protein
VEYRPSSGEDAGAAILLSRRIALRVALGDIADVLPSRSSGIPGSTATWISIASPSPLLETVPPIVVSSRPLGHDR